MDHWFVLPPMFLNILLLATPVHRALSISWMLLLTIDRPYRSAGMSWMAFQWKIINHLSLTCCVYNSTHVYKFLKKNMQEVNLLYFMLYNLRQNVMWIFTFFSSFIFEFSVHKDSIFIDICSGIKYSIAIVKGCGVGVPGFGGDF